MGNGISPIVGETIFTSLNEIFGTRLAETRMKYGMLNTLYPNFLVYMAKTTTTDLHVWRKRTLRHAAWLLTSEVDFRSGTHQFPAKKFRKWLKWLTWLQLRPPADATVTVNGVVATIAPAQAIMSTLKMALDDQFASGVSFRWTEDDHVLVVDVMQQPGTAQQPGKYAISVVSQKESNSLPDTDEDDLP
jgi:hypothetical protein